MFHAFDLVSERFAMNVCLCVCVCCFHALVYEMSLAQHKPATESKTEVNITTYLAKDMLHSIYTFKNLFATFNIPALGISVLNRKLLEICAKVFDFCSKL